MPPSSSFRIPSLTLPTGPLRLLKNSNYLKYFSGQLVSLSGSWMQSVAQAWLVYRLSHSSYWLGAITFCGQIPAFLVSPIAGVVADQADRRKVLILVQISEMTQALVLAALVFSGHVQLWHVVGLAILSGVATAFDMTTRHAFAIDMVGRDELSAAIALNSVLINLTRVFGPVVAGLLLASVGEGWCFMLNGLSYVPVIVGLATMTVRPAKRERSGHGLLTEIADGVSYARRQPLIWRILLLSSGVCLIACPYSALLPVFAKGVLGGDATTLAGLTGALGMGAVTAAFLFSGASATAVIKRRLIGDVIFWGLGLVTLGLSRSLWLSLGAMFTIGYFMMSLFPTMNNALQQTVDDARRGRIMSLYTMTFLGTMPVGSLCMGWLADRFTAPKVVAGAGLLTLAMGLGLALRDVVRNRLQLISATTASSTQIEN